MIEACAAWRPESATISPQSGWWWSAAESGRGYGIEIKDGRAFIGAYMYDTDGTPVWYVSTGTMTSTTSYSGDLLEFRGGQTLSGSWRAASSAGSPGRISLSFTSATTGTLTLPNGNGVSLQRYDIVAGGVSAGASAGMPEAGWWWNAAEGGRGYFLEVQGAANALFLATYMYENDGSAAWYAALGTVIQSAFSSGQLFSGRLYEYRGGQTLNGRWQDTTGWADRGALSILFHSSTVATLTLPNGRPVPLTRYTF